MRIVRFVVLLAAVLAAGTGIALVASGGQPGPVKTASVTLLPDNLFYAALTKAVGEARKEVLVGTFMFIMRNKPANLADRLAGVLAAAARRGVRVTVVLESDARNTEVTRDNQKTGTFLAKEGVRVLYDNPRVTAHAKLAVIDGRWAFIGSHNLTDAALDHNREFSVLLDSPEAAAVVRSYLESLAGASLR